MAKRIAAKIRKLVYLVPSISGTDQSSILRLLIYIEACEYSFGFSRFTGAG
jgi:hypothetical protein